MMCKSKISMILENKTTASNRFEMLKQIIVQGMSETNILGSIKIQIFIQDAKCEIQGKTVSVEDRLLTIPYSIRQGSL